MSYFDLDGSKLTKDELKRRLGFIDHHLAAKEHTRKYYLELYNELLNHSEYKNTILGRLDSERKELEEEHYYLRSMCKHKRNRSPHENDYCVDLNTPDFRKRREITQKKKQKT